MELRTDHPLAALNSLRLSARAAFFCRATSPAELVDALAHARRHDLPVLVLGGGSNVVFSRDWPGLVVQPALRGVEVIERGRRRIRLRVAAGEDWPALVERCLAAGWFGLENLALIPGSAGAAPVQNIGAYGVELADRLVAVAALERATGQTLRLSRDDCRFGYRESVFKRHPDRYLITAIELQLDLEPTAVLTYQPLAAELERSGVGDPGPRDIFRAVCDLRRAKLPDPDALPNAGSFFVNPTVDAGRWQRLRRRHPRLVAFEQPGGSYKLAAGWLVERCGYKGHRQGAIGVSPDQALVLINHGGATGAELLALAERIRGAVRETFGVELAIEPRVI